MKETHCENRLLKVSDSVMQGKTTPLCSSSSDPKSTERDTVSAAWRAGVCCSQEPGGRSGHYKGGRTPAVLQPRSASGEPLRSGAELPPGVRLPDLGDEPADDRYSNGHRVRELRHRGVRGGTVSKRRGCEHRNQTRDCQRPRAPVPLSEDASAEVCTAWKRRGVAMCQGPTRLVPTGYWHRK